MKSSSYARWQRLAALRLAWALVTYHCTRTRPRPRPGKDTALKQRAQPGEGLGAKPNLLGEQRHD